MDLLSPHIAAVIFDFDGTLVDTMPLHFEAYRRVFAELNLPLTTDDFYGNVGGSARESIPKFLRGRACPVGIDEIHSRKKLVVRELFASEPIRVLPTARRLELLAGHVKMAVASSGSREGIEQLLGRLDWSRYFKAVICGGDVARGKPAPDLFLLAAERLAVAPENCLVFEDTPAGIAAAHSAGMEVIDVRLDDVAAAVRAL